MFKRILVAADNLGHSSRALYVAQQLATRIHAQLLVLHVEPNNAVFDLTADERELRAAVRALRAQGLDARFVLDYGRPEECIVTTVARERVDLVVMAPHNRGLIEAIRRPSVTQNVLAQGTTPVLAWPQHLSPELDAVLLHTPGSLVIVPLDGSPRAEEALPLAAELAAHFGRSLLLLRVVPTHGEQRVGVGPDGEQVSGIDFLEAEARAHLADVRERFLGLGGGKMQVETMVKHGEPTGEIERAARLHPGSVIVMSTRGRGELARLVLGSVSEGVIRSAPTPVLIVPPKVSAPGRPRSLAQAKV
jgi:nucleotide-binding universal stress UspA family protein